MFEKLARLKKMKRLLQWKKMLRRRRR